MNSKQQPTRPPAKRGGRREKVHEALYNDGTPIPLGEWAYNFRQRNQRLPTVEECRDHHDGKRIYIQANGAA